MSHRTQAGPGLPDLGGRLTPGVKALILANGIAYLAVMLLRSVLPGVERTFGLVPADLFARVHLWQLVTYLFLHGGLFHLLFNMLALFVFGGDIERTWGTPEFLKYYFFTGIGAGLVQWAVAMNSPIPTIGASGAIFGVLLAFGLLFPDRQVLLYFVIPIPARYLVILFGFVELVAVSGGRADGIARFAHLGGLLFGLAYLKGGRLLRPLRRWWAVRAGARDDRRRASVREEIDTILEKISREGTGGLTRRERQVLEEAARRGRTGKRT